ncbi:RRQRL motif-containing zinc-binding protein [Sciscionella marina]|uniref:RRQRL motif-containing zinc-binding protein n=1 Tax=Sciscionella marina TaxID=508770 RepID=UPI000376DB9F|nr:RRQRL motif-containing zinc-binding protein [Sciscionella marina]
MAGKQFPIVKAEVPWSTGWEFTRGEYDGLPLLSHGWAPRELLATRRQLRELGLRPGGADPVAVLYVRHAGSGRVNYANLYLIAAAKPVRPMTPARKQALEAALAGRRRCYWCGEDTGRYQPRQAEQRFCDACLFEHCDLDPWDELHHYVDPVTIGEKPAWSAPAPAPGWALAA